MAELTELYEILIPLLNGTEREIRDRASYPIRFLPYDDTVSAIDKRLRGVLTVFVDKYNIAPLADQFKLGEKSLPDFLRRLNDENCVRQVQAQ